MKKIILSAALCGGVLLASAATLTVAHADDVKKDSTVVTSEVTKGDLTLVVEKDADFGTKPLASTVTFDTRNIGFNVIDYSGNTDGYEVSAKLTDKDEKRVLKLADKELSDAPQVISAPKTNKVGDNGDAVSAVLSYTGITKVQKYASTIEWSVEPATALLAE